MLYLSEVLIQNPELQNFDELLEVIKVRAKSEMFFFVIPPSTQRAILLPDSAIMLFT